MKYLFYSFIAASILFSACKAKKEEAPVIPTEDVVEMTTPFGNMYIWLYKATPLHRANFLKLSNDGFFNNTTFHRVIPNFMVQGGDPNRCRHHK